MNLPISARVRRLLKPQTIFSLMLAAFAAVLAPAVAQGQITLSTGTSQSLGAVALGSKSTSMLKFNVAANAVLAKTAVVTGGATGKDFTDAGDGSCTPQTFGTAASCTVDVIFQPIAAGSRNGAVIFYDNSNNVIGMAPVNGIGDGAQIAYGPGTPATVPLVIGTAALPAGNAVAVDGTGDLFVAYLNLPRVLEIPADGSSPLPIALTSLPKAKAAKFLTVDGAGNLFVVMDTGDVLEVPPPYATSVPVPLSQLNNGDSKGGLAVDGQGNLFVADSVSALVDELPLPYATSALASFTPRTGGNPVLVTPNGMTVDGKGDLFFGNSGANNVVEVSQPYGTSTPVVINPTVDGQQLSGPSGVAVDAAGDLFVADTNNHRVVEVPAGGGAALAINPPAGQVVLGSVPGLAIDAFGNLFATDQTNSLLYELQQQSATVNFPTPTKAGTSDTTDGTQTVQVINIGTQKAGEGLLALYPADFSIGTQGNSACIPGEPLIPGGSGCGLAIQFTPASATPAGPVSESVGIGVLENTSPIPGGAVTVTGTVTSATTGPNKTTIMLTAQANPGTLGTQDSITAALSTASGVAAPTGMVTFSILDIPLGVATLSGGKATFANLLLQAGTYQLTATYSGDANYATATATYSGTVNQGTPKVALAAAANPGPLGSMDTITATVSSPLTAVGVAAPSGMVTFYLGTIPLKTATLVNGQASYSNMLLQAGSYQITATYSGDTNFITETNTFTGKVSQAAPVLTLIPPVNPVVGQQVTLTATVASPLTASGVAAPTGTVSFTFGGLPLGLPVTLKNGVAAIMDTPPISGQFPVVAVYSGDTNFVTQTRSLTVAVAGMPQTITFTSPTVTYGVGSIDLSKYAKASSGLPVSFTLDSGTGGTLSGSILKVTGRGGVNIKVSQAGDSTYAVAPNVYGTVNINAAVLSVHLEDAGTVYGASIPSPQGYTITGLVNGDSLSVVTGAAQAGVVLPGKFPYPAGSYPNAIVGNKGTLAAANYTFTMVPANLTIYKAQLVVTANDLYMSNGSPVPPLTYTIGGFLAGDTLATAVKGAPMLNTTGTSASAAGSYPITSTNGTLAAPNYNFMPVNGTLTVQ